MVFLAQIIQRIVNRYFCSKYLESPDNIVGAFVFQIIYVRINLSSLTKEKFIMITIFLDEGIFVFCFEKKEIGRVQNEAEFKEIIKNLFEEGKISKNDFESLPRSFEEQKAYLTGESYFKALSIGFYLESETIAIHEQLRESTEKSFRELDEAQRESWRRSHEIILGAATG
jgi:hypothetical protein